MFSLQNTEGNDKAYSCHNFHQYINKFLDTIRVIGYGLFPLIYSLFYFLGHVEIAIWCEVPHCVADRTVTPRCFVFGLFKDQTHYCFCAQRYCDIISLLRLAFRRPENTTCIVTLRLQSAAKRKDNSVWQNGQNFCCKYADISLKKSVTHAFFLFNLIRIQ